MKLREEGKTVNGVDYDEKLRDGNYKTELTSEISDKLKTVTHTPKDKWNVPQTSNQEIGWFVDVRFYPLRKRTQKILSLCIRDRAAQRRTMLIAITR